MKKMFNFFFSITYHCPVGEMPVGKVNQTCENIGIWSGLPIGCKRVECGQVPGLANGEIHVLDGRTTYGARVRYKCKTDYSLIGGKNRIFSYRNIDIYDWYIYLTYIYR